MEICDTPYLSVIFWFIQACEMFGGTFCYHDADCVELKNCVEEMIDEANSTGLYAFLTFLEAMPAITNGTDAYECGK